MKNIISERVCKFGDIRKTIRQQFLDCGVKDQEFDFKMLHSKLDITMNRCAIVLIVVCNVFLVNGKWR